MAPPPAAVSSGPPRPAARRSRSFEAADFRRRRPFFRAADCLRVEDFFFGRLERAPPSAEMASGPRSSVPLSPFLFVVTGLPVFGRCPLTPTGPRFGNGQLAQPLPSITPAPERWARSTIQSLYTPGDAPSLFPRRHWMTRKRPNRGGRQNQRSKDNPFRCPLPRNRKERKNLDPALIYRRVSSTPVDLSERLRPKSPNGGGTVNPRACP